MEPARRAAGRWPRRRRSIRRAPIDDSLALLEMAEVGPLDEIQRAQAEVLRARIAFATNRGGDAPPLLLAAARRLEHAGPAAGARDLPRRVDRSPVQRAPGRPARGTKQVADAALAAPPAPDPRPTDLLLDGLATLIAHGPEAGTPRCGSPSRPSRAATSNPPRPCAGDGWRVGRRASSGTTRDGTASPITTSGQPGRRGCSPSWSWRSPHASASISSAGETTAAAGAHRGGGRARAGDRRWRRPSLRRVGAGRPPRS